MARKRRAARRRTRGLGLDQVVKGLLAAPRPAPVAGEVRFGSAVACEVCRGAPATRRAANAVGESWALCTTCHPIPAPCAVCDGDATCRVGDETLCDSCEMPRSGAAIETEGVEVDDEPDLDEAGNAIVPLSPAELEPWELAPDLAQEPSAEDVFTHFFAGLNPNTHDAYRRDLAAFARYLGAPDARAAVGAVLRLDGGRANRLALGWKQSMLAGGASTATVARRLSALRSVTKLGRMLGIIAWAIEIRSGKILPSQDTAGPGSDAVRRMIAATEHPRDVLVLLLLITLGVRRLGISQLRLRDYDRDGRRLFVRDKGGKERWMDLPDVTREALDRWLAERGPGEPDDAVVCSLDDERKKVSPSAVWWIVRQAARRAGVKHAWPHGIRHTAITAVAVKHGLLAAQRFANHSDPRTTQRYIDNFNDPTRQASEDLAALVTGEEKKT